jgi:hypothetical protein
MAQFRGGPAAAEGSDEIKARAFNKASRELDARTFKIRGEGLRSKALVVFIDKGLAPGVGLNHHENTCYTDCRG